MPVGDVIAGCRVARQQGLLHLRPQRDTEAETGIEIISAVGEEARLSHYAVGDKTGAGFAVEDTAVGQMDDHHMGREMSKQYPCKRFGNRTFPS